MKRNTTGTITIIIVILILAGGGWWYVSHSPTSPEPVAQNDASSTPSSATQALGSSGKPATSPVAGSSSMPAPSISLTTISTPISPAMTIIVAYANMPSVTGNILNSAGALVKTAPLAKGSGSSVVELSSVLPTGDYRAQAVGAGSTVYATSLPYHFVHQTFKVDQTSISSGSDNAFTLSGTESEKSSIFVALVPASYSGSSACQTIYANHAYTAYTVDPVNVSGTHWSTVFTGVASGTYTVLAYDHASEALLGSGRLSVTSPSSFDFTAGSHDVLTIGVGQSATDGGIRITLNSITYSNGTTGTALAHFTITPEGFAASTESASAGMDLPSSGGYGDPKSPTTGVSFHVSNVSVPMGTATLEFNTVKKG